MMAAADRDEDKARDARRFYQSVFLEPARKHNVAAVVTDHVVKNGEGGRYSRGSGDKLNTIDVGYRTEALEPWDRERSGVIRLVRTKDRRGWLGRDRAYEIAVKIDGAGGVALDFSGGHIPDATARLSPSARRVYAALKNAGRPVSVRDIGDELASEQGKPPLKHRTIQDALKALADAGLADSEPSRAATPMPGGCACATPPSPSSPRADRVRATRRNHAPDLH
jgi:hypothetical protein